MDIVTGGADNVMTPFMALVLMPLGEVRVKRSERLIALSESLRRAGSRGTTAERLAGEFGVSVRTIKRDLHAVANAGFPVWSRPGPGGGYGLATGGTLPPITLSPSQAVALMAAVSATNGAPYSDLAAAGIRKILDGLDPATRADELAQRVWIDHDSAPPRRVMSAAEQAMSDQKVLRIRYVSAEDAVTRRDIEPMLFASTNGHWYLVGWCRLRTAVRWFRMDRILQATVTTMDCTAHAIAEIGTPPPTARPVQAHRP